MLRRLLRLSFYATLLAVIATLGAGAWLAGTTSGLQTLIKLASDASNGQLQIEQASGSLNGTLDIGRLRWHNDKLRIEGEALHLDWSPAALLHGQLAIAELTASRLQVVSQPDEQPSTLPADLSLPLTVNLKKLQISQFVWGESLVINDIAGHLASDGRHHQFDQLHARLADVTVDAQARLDGQAPFPLTATAELKGQLAERPLALSLNAGGQLDRLETSAVASQGIAGQATAIVTPFAKAPFASARVQLEHIDPATWVDGAPQASMSITADIVPLDEGISGSFGLTNQQPGPLDKQRLPLEPLAGTLIWQGEQLQMPSLHARLSGQGELAGDGAWREQTLHLNLLASHLDASQLLTKLRPTRLNGPISTTIATGRQSARLDFKDQTFTLQAGVSHTDGHIELSQLLLGAGNARVSAHGELNLQTPRQFSAEGELQRFDPSRFAKVPAAQINARFKADGHLAPRPVVDASFILHDSRLANQALAGQGKLQVDWPRIPSADIQLLLGGNRLTALGAFGQPGDLLKLDIDAPQLAPYGIDGGITGKFEFSGGIDQPHLAGTLNAARLGLPGSVHVSGLRLKADGGGAATAPLLLEVDIADLETPDQPALLSHIRIRAEGSNQRHQIRATTTITGHDHLTLAAEGGLSTPDSGPQWQGQLTEAGLESQDKARNFRLLTAAALQFSANQWRFGPAQLAGSPLDWQATLQASATTKQLQASLKAQGSRLGLIDGQLQAAMNGPWSLNKQAPWQGKLSSKIADLGWLAELIGDSWKSEGHFQGALQLAGTPAKPLISGRFQGDSLGLRLADQGLALVNGQLDIALRDNLLHVNHLGFDSLLQALPRALQLDGRNDLATLTKTPGRLEISGEMRVDRERGDESAFLDLRLDRVGAFQLPDQWIALSGDGRLTWQTGTIGAHAKLKVDAGYWQLAPGGAPRLSDDVVVKRPGSAPADENIRPKLDLEINTDLGSNFLFKGAGLSSKLNGSVRVAAQGRDLPRATGVISTRDGRYEAYGQKLSIERGILRFNGLLDNPGIDVVAVRKGLSVEPGVHISGTARKPVVKLVSDPDLPDAEKLAWLVLGHGPEQMSAGDAAVLVSAAGGLLGNESGGVIQQLKTTFGFDEFGVRQGSIGDSGGRQQVSRVAGGNNIDTTSNTGNQIFSVGKRLSSNAMLSYEQTLGKAEGIVKLTVNLTRRISVIGRAGSDNAIDLLYTITFGRNKEPAAVKKQKQQQGQP